jgi:hypothetical protein
MKYGFVLPSGDALTAGEFAFQAEIYGWDGFFVWEPVWGVDAWICLTAAALRTNRIRLGTMLSPISRMRPWKLASETATLDNLSAGRVILSVGLGAPESGFHEFGEVTDRKIRAELLDEGLEILTGLWRGQPFEYNGKHYHIQPTNFMLPDPPLQKPRIPIWVVGNYPSSKSMQRALRYDGLLPAMKDLQTGEWTTITPLILQEICKYCKYNRQADSPYDIVWEGTTNGDDPNLAADQVRPWAEAGATWWIEAMWQAPDKDSVLRRIQQGPPEV